MSEVVMTAPRKSPSRRERGVYFIIMTIGMAVVLALAALGIDGAKLFHERLMLQKAADAAVLAGLAYRIQIGPPDAAGNGFLEGTDLPTAGTPCVSVLCKAAEVAQANITYANLTGNPATVYTAGAAAPLSRYDSAATPEKLTVTLFKRVDFYLLDLVPFGLFNVQNISGADLYVTAEGELAPARVALVLDFSGSMCCGAANAENCLAGGGTCATAPDRKVDRLSDAAQTFVSKFRAGRDAISLVPFNITAKVEKKLADPADPFNPATWKTAIANLAVNPASDTNPSDALVQAYRDYRNSPVRGNGDMNYVLFSDGAPTAGRFLFQSVPADPADLLPAWDPHDLGTADPDSYKDYYNYKVEWHGTDASGAAISYLGPSPLLQSAEATSPYNNYANWFLPYDWAAGKPPSYPGTPGMPACSALYSGADRFKALSLCRPHLQLAVPFSDVDGDAILYGADIAFDDNWSKQYYNATLTMADYIRDKEPGTSTFYVIGLGEVHGAKLGSGNTADPYMNANSDYDRKDFFLTRLALDKDLCPLDPGDPNCQPGGGLRTCCQDPASAPQYQQDFPITASDGTTLNPWTNYGVTKGTYNDPAGVAQRYAYRYRFGEYLPTNDANELKALFQRVARKILLRLIT